MRLQALEDSVATKFSNLRPVHKNELIDDFKLSLRIKPRICLFFTDGKYPPSADCDNVPFESNNINFIKSIQFCSFLITNSFNDNNRIIFV